MRMKIAALLACGGILALGGCASSTQPKAENAPKKEAQKAGGYSKSETADTGIKAAAEFAVTELSQKTNAKLALVKILEAQTQIVAGTNYNLSLEVSGGESKTVEVVVWKKLDGKYELTKSSWQK